MAFIGIINSKLLDFIKQNQGDGFIEINNATDFKDPNLQRILMKFGTIQDKLTELVCDDGVLEFNGLGYRYLDFKDRPCWAINRRNEINGRMPESFIQQRNEFKANYLTLTTIAIHP